MKIPQFILVFLILASLLLAGCTDRKPKTSDSSADLPKPTLSPGTPEATHPDSSAASASGPTDSPETSQPGTQEPPDSETDSEAPETSADTASGPTDSPETSQPGTQEPPTSETDPPTPGTSAADTSAPLHSDGENETDPLDSAEDLGGQAATTENTSDADPDDPEITDDPDDIPLDENPTIYVSGDVELIGGD